MLDEEPGRDVASPSIEADRLRAIGGGVASSRSSSESSKTKDWWSLYCFCTSRAALGERRIAGGRASSMSIAICERLNHGIWKKENRM